MASSSDYQPVTDEDFTTDSLEYTGENVWNAVYTTQLGELIEHGLFSWDDTMLNWYDASYAAQEDTKDPGQYKRVCDYFVERYRFCEVSIEPLYEWKTRLHACIVYELCPKYNALYKRLAEGWNPLQDSSDYEKRREIGSEYPETLLSKNADYLSTGTDLEYEHVHEGNVTDALLNYAKNFHYVDELFLDDLEKFFIGLYTSHTNAL